MNRKNDSTTGLNICFYTIAVKTNLVHHIERNPQTNILDPSLMSGHAAGTKELGGGHIEMLQVMVDLSQN